MHESSWIWIVVVVLFVIAQAWRGLIRSVKNAEPGMARLNAAAERILKERQGAGSRSNPNPRTKSMQAKSAAAKVTRSQSGVGAKPRNTALLPKSSTPAVIRRTGILGGREPVIQRRR